MKGDHFAFEYGREVTNLRAAGQRVMELKHGTRDDTGIDPKRERISVIQRHRRAGYHVHAVFYQAPKDSRDIARFCRAETGAVSETVNLWGLEP
jgi:hypothetical protein